MQQNTEENAIDKCPMYCCSLGIIGVVVGTLVGYAAVSSANIDDGTKLLIAISIGFFCGCVLTGFGPVIEAAVKKCFVQQEQQQPLLIPVPGAPQQAR